MSKKWIPSSAECRLIREAAAREAVISYGAVVLEPGRRFNTETGSIKDHINIALISDDPEWKDTDLSEYVEWKEFRRGIELTDDGRAIVDFYVRRRSDPDKELLGNVTVYYEEGRIVRIHGYGSPTPEYPVK